MAYTADAPTFSVIATVRNEKKGISDFIESLLGQSLRPDEIIIVDGVSTDGTLEILREYESRGKIRVISQPCNISQGRNLGVAAAKNEFIAATDAGCTADQKWLENLAKVFLLSPAPDIVAGNYEFETHNDFELASCLATDPPDREDSDAAKFYPSSRSIAFRKSAWSAIGGYPEWLYAAEDTLFNIQLRRKGLKFRFARDAKVSWRPRSTWKGLYKQHYNYARGNGRIGLGLAGYTNGLRTHGLMLSLLALSLLWPWIFILAALVGFRYVNANFWKQAKFAQQKTGRRNMLWKTLLVMETVRIAGMAGYLRGRRDRKEDPKYIESQVSWMGCSSVEPSPPFPHWSSIGLTFALPTQVLLTLYLWKSAATAPALLVATFLALKSYLNFSRTGPELKGEILSYYSTYTLQSFARLIGWSFIVCLIMCGYGQTLLAVLSPTPPKLSPWYAWGASFLGIFVLSAYQFCRHLLLIPGSLAASSNYRLSRFDQLWFRLSPELLNWTGGIIAGLFAVSSMATIATTMSSGDHLSSFVLVTYYLNTIVFLLAATWTKEPAPLHLSHQPGANQHLNLLMIGCDTLRADRLGKENYPRPLTPNLDKLIEDGTYLSNCFVPCARTAPSLASLLTGLLPQNHGIRDNFALQNEARFSVRPLPHILSDAGYQTIAISDWAGADLGKFDFGFNRRHLPDDQWNIRYLIRQGPKDIRLFLSLFTHNRFGRRYIPEIHYLAGVPMTRILGRTTREFIKDAATQNAPFFINTFFSSTHAPFGSEYPFYTSLSHKDYQGDSKFVMANLDEPFEIIKRQQDGAKDVDLDQILSLYDGCVQNFDDELGRIIHFLEQSGLRQNTVIVVYSDHGIDFFEHGSWGQGNSVISDESARVPVVIVDPRNPQASEITQLTRTIDIAPTILEILGLQQPPGMDGVSLAKHRTEPVAEDLPVYGETGIWFTKIPSMPVDHAHYPDLPELLEVPDKMTGTISVKPHYKKIVLDAKDKMIRAGAWKLVRMPMTYGLKYSLYASEPQIRGGYRDVGNSHSEIMADMKAKFGSLFESS